MQSLKAQRETIQRDRDVLAQKEAALGKREAAMREREAAMRHDAAGMDGYPLIVKHDPPCLQRAGGKRPTAVRQLLRREGRKYSESECSESECSELELSESQSDPDDRLSDMSDIEEWLEDEDWMEQDHSFGTKTAIREQMRSCSDGIRREVQMQAREVRREFDDRYLEDYCDEEVVDMSDAELAHLGHREALQREKEEERLEEIHVWREFHKEQKKIFFPENMRRRIVSFAMALHHRLGDSSAAKVLDNNIIMIISRFQEDMRTKEEEEVEEAESIDDVEEEELLQDIEDADADLDHLEQEDSDLDMLMCSLGGWGSTTWEGEGMSAKTGGLLAMYRDLREEAVDVASDAEQLAAEMFEYDAAAKNAEELCEECFSVASREEINVALAALRVAIAALVEYEPMLKHKRDELEAIEEIHVEQRSTTPIFDRYEFFQMTDPLTENFMSPSAEFHPRALTKLHAVAEDYMVRFVQKCNALAMKDGRSILHLTDIQTNSRLGNQNFSSSNLPQQPDFPPPAAEEELRKEVGSWSRTCHSVHECTTESHMRRLVRRAGVKRVCPQVFTELGWILMRFLEDVMHSAVTCADHSRKICISEGHMTHALQSRGYTVYS